MIFIGIYFIFFFIKMVKSGFYEFFFKVIFFWKELFFLKNLDF